MSSNTEDAVTNRKDDVLANINEKASGMNAVERSLKQGNVSIAEMGDRPTEEELVTLRRVPDKIPFKVYTVAFVELCERFSYYGTTVVCKFIIAP